MKLADEMSAFHPQVSWSRIAKTEQLLSFLKDDFLKPLSGVNLSLKEPESHVCAEQSIRKSTVSQYKIRVRRSNRNTCSSEYRLLHLLLRQSSDCSIVFFYSFNYAHYGKHCAFCTVISIWIYHLLLQCVVDIIKELCKIQRKMFTCVWHELKVYVILQCRWWDDSNPLC